MLKRRTKPTGFRKKSWFDIDLKEGLNDWQNNDDWEGDGDDDSLGNDELHIPDVDTAAEEYLSKYHICDTSDAHLAPPALSYYALDKKIIKSKKSSSKKSQSAVDDPKPFKIVSSKSANIQKWRSDTNDGWDIIEPAVPKEESNVAEFQCAAAMIEEMSDGCSSLFTEKDLTDSSHLGVNQNVISMDDLTPCNLNSSSTRLATILGSNSVICIESDGLESATSRDGSEHESLEMADTDGFPLKDCQGCKVSVNTSSISETQLFETYGNNYIESRSMPRKFAIILDQSQLKGRTSNRYCFIIAECWKFNVLQQTSDLNLKIFGYKRDIHQVLQSVKERELQTNFDVLIRVILQSKTLRMPPKTPDVERKLLQDLTKWRPKAVTVIEAYDLLIKELITVSTTNENTAASNACDIPVGMLPVTYTCGLCNEVMPEYNATREENAEIQLKECLHAYCKGCWDTYLTGKIYDSVRYIKCPSLDCQTVVDMVTIVAIVSPDNAFRHLKTSLESKITDSKEWKRCPSCDFLAFCTDFKDANLLTRLADLPVVQCRCMSTWCFLCKNDGHWPAHCDEVVLYEKIQNEESRATFENKHIVTQLRYLIRDCWKCQQPVSMFIEFSCCSYMFCNKCDSQFCLKASRKPNRVHEEMCIEYQSIAHLFTTLDPAQVRTNGKIVRRAFMLRYYVYRLEKRKKQLRLDNERRSVEERNLLPKRKMLAHAIAVHKEASEICENVQLTRLKSASKHYNGRLYRFMDTAEVLLNRVKDGLNKRSQEIDMIEVETALAKLQAHMLSIKSIES